MKKQKITSLILTLTMILGLVNIPVLAQNADIGGKIKIDTSLVTGGEGYKGSPYKNAVDGDYASFYDGLQGQYVQIQLDKEYEISAIGFVPRSGKGMPDRMVGGVFEGSADGTNWNTLYTIDAVPEYNASSSIKILAENFTEGTSPYSYKYIKYSVPSEQYCNIAEIELYSTEIEPEPTEEPEPTKAPNDEFVFYDDFQTYYDDKSIVGKEGWQDGGSDSSRSLKKKIDGLDNRPYLEFIRASSGNSAFAYNSFGAQTDTIIYEFDLRMTGGKGAVGLQKSGNVSSHWQYTTGVHFDSYANTISAVTADSARETLITNAYKSKWYHIKMEVDTNTKKANFYTYDGDKPLGSATGIALMDTDAADIGNVFMMLEEANSGFDVANITVKADASKTLDDDYSVNTTDDNGKTPEALIYSDNFKKYNNNAVIDWSTSGSDGSANMVKLSEGDVSFARAQRGSGNSKGYFKPVSINTTAVAEFKVRPSVGGGIVIGFSSDGGKIHQMSWNPMDLKVITALGVNTGGISIIKDKIHTSEAVTSANGWYTVKYVVDTISKLYNVNVLDADNNSLLTLNSQPFVTGDSSNIVSFGIGLNEKNSSVDITDIKICENSSIRILPGFFSDINDETTAYRSDIEYMYENGYLEPLNYGDSFEPSTVAKNSEFATITAEVICKPKGQPYSGDNDYIQTLKDLGIIDNSFDTNAEITRDMAAEIIWKAYQYKTNAKSEQSVLEACIASGLIQSGAYTVNRDEMCNIANTLRKAIEKSNITNALATNITPLNQAPEHKLSLWYNSPAWSANPPEKYNKIDPQFQQQALPVGNGYMGATIYGAPQMERIQFNDDAFYAGAYLPREDKYENGEKVDIVAKYQEMVGLLKRVKSYDDTYMKQARSIADKYFTDKNIPEMNYLCAGNFFIEHTDMPKNAAITNYRRDLDIEDAVAHVQFTYDGTDYMRELFANYPEHIIAMKLTADGSKKLNLAIRLDEHHTNNLSIKTTGDNLITMSGNADDKDGDGLDYEVQLKVEAKDGSQRGAGDRIFIENASEVVLYLRTGTEYDINNVPSFKSSDPQKHRREVSEAIENASALGYDKLKENHIKDYTEIFNRLELNLGDELTNDIPTDTLRHTYGETGNKMLDMLFFQYGRYMLISSSRAGSLPANLQGVWNSSNTPSWGSGYTVNVNLQMNYWPSGVTNMKETMQPFIDLLKMASGELTGQTTAKYFYGNTNGGWMSHSGMDVWGYTGPGAEVRYAHSPGSSAWLCQNLWDFYEYTQDEEILDSVYEIIKGNTKFFVQDLTLRDGKYVTGPSISPEQGPLLLGTKYDMQLVYELFTNFLKGAELTGETDTELVEQVKHIQSNMKSPWEIGASQNGQLMEWDLDIDDIIYNADNPHRHVSHMMAVFPTAQINRNTPEFMDAAKRTMNLRGDEATGWSRAIKTATWTRLLGDDGSGTGTTGADHAYRMFQGQIEKFTYDNLYDAHAPFQADGNFGATAALCEFMMQSGTGKIDILPALPTAWKNKGKVKGLMARGGFEMNLEWINGKATKIELTSTAGNDCTLNYPYFADDVTVMSGGNPVSYTRNGNSITFSTEKDSVYTVNAGNGNVYECEISDIVLDKGDTLGKAGVEEAQSIKEVIVTKHSNTSDTAVLYTVAYDENGVLAAIDTADVDFSEYLLDTSKAVPVNMTLPEGTKTVKAFLWNSFDGMKPLAMSYLKN